MKHEAQMATSAGGVEWIVKPFLLEKHTLDNEQMNPHRAFCELHVFALCLQMLVERGLNPDLPDSKGSTPLKYALFRNHVDVVKYLISINCNVEVSNHFATMGDSTSFRSPFLPCSAKEFTPGPVFRQCFVPK